MNDSQQGNNHKLLKNNLIKINPVDIHLPDIKSAAKKFPADALKKKNGESKDESSSYDELHYGNYE